jgi:hypothetical protein
MKRGTHPIKPHHHTAFKRCETCGRVLEKNRLKYCSSNCRSQFRFKLSWFNNILRAISAKYASFSFTDEFLILNVLPHNSDRVHTFFHERTPGKKPAQDMNQMIFDLGKLWWNQIEQDPCRKRASESILARGRTDIVSLDRVTPVEKIHFSNISKQMFLLELNKRDLYDPQGPAEETVKAAFRKAARKHHPDLGGNSEHFRKAYQAYQDLLSWLSHPHITTSRGIPGQWCYLARNDTWLKPL